PCLKRSEVLREASLACTANTAPAPPRAAPPARKRIAGRWLCAGGAGVPVGCGSASVSGAGETPAGGGGGGGGGGGAGAGPGRGGGGGGAGRATSPRAGDRGRWARPR